MKATSHLPDLAASATAPGLGKGTSSTGTPSRLPSSCPRSAAMPFGLPVAASVAVRRKLLMLRPTCSVPVGASALRASEMSVMPAPAERKRRMLTPARRACPHPGLRCRLGREHFLQRGAHRRPVYRALGAVHVALEIGSENDARHADECSAWARRPRRSAPSAVLVTRALLRWKEPMSR